MALGKHRIFPLWFRQVPASTCPTPTHLCDQTRAQCVARTHARRCVCVCVGWGGVGESRVGQWNVSQHGNMTAKCWTKIERQVKQVHAFTKPLVHRVLNPWLGKKQHAVTGCSVSMALALIHTAPHLPSSCQTNRARCRTPPPRPPPAS
jgi:hypothetical protein